MVFRRFTAALCCVSENMRSTATEWSRRSSTSCVRSRRKQASDVPFRRSCSFTPSAGSNALVFQRLVNTVKETCLHMLVPLNNSWKEKVLCCSSTLCIGCFRARISVGECGFVAIAVRKWRKTFSLFELSLLNHLYCTSLLLLILCVCVQKSSSVLVRKVQDSIPNRHKLFSWNVYLVAFGWSDEWTSCLCIFGGKACLICRRRLEWLKQWM